MSIRLLCVALHEIEQFINQLDREINCRQPSTLDPTVSNQQCVLYCLWNGGSVD